MEGFGKEGMQPLPAVAGGDDADWVRRFGFEALIRLINPMTPHLAEELWQRLGHTTLLTATAWPDYDPAMIVADRLDIAVQVNGKLRGTVALPRDCPQDEAEAAALALDAVARSLDGRAPKRVIVVPNRIVNVVA